MKEKMLNSKRIANFLQTVTLLTVMAAVTGLLAYMVAGKDGVIVAVFATWLVPLITANVPTRRLLRLRGIQPLNRTRFAQLYALADSLAAKAGLEAKPELYCETSKMMNAFAAGSRENPIIVLTDSLLRRLDAREIAGILGHEMGHIINNDLRVMALAQAVGRMTSFLSTFGQIMILLSFPLIITGKIQLALLPLLFLIFAPTICFLLQLALSRTREFEADAAAVEITGDSKGLACALYKLERFHRGLQGRLLMNPWSRKPPSWLQTHPVTEERIERILELSQTPVCYPDESCCGGPLQPTIFTRRSPLHFHLMRG